MFKHIVIFLSLVAALNGVPLDRTSADLSKYFTERIIGGVDAPEGYAPHMVALVGGTFFVSVGCGGSIVSKKHVLTAAHCIAFYVVDGKFSPNFHGRVGSNQWRSGGTRVEFASHSIHPEYDSVYIKNDAGVLTLREELELNDRVAVIALKYDRIEGGHPIYVTGWGIMGPRIGDTVVELAPTPEDLQLLYLHTISAQQCIYDIEKMSSILGWAPHVEPEVEICAFHSHRHGMCSGDSGSAMVSLESGCQIGLVSWGFPCAVGAPDVFASISGLKDYLEPMLKSYL